LYLYLTVLIYMNLRHLLIAFASLLFIAYGCGPDKTTEPVKNDSITTVANVPSLDYRTVHLLPHDTSSFTEGFFIHDGVFYESTGSPENYPMLRSIVGPLDTTTGKIISKAELDRNQFFGEGTIIFGDKLYQLTYTTQIGFIYDAKTFKQLGRFSFENKEGWGLTTDGKNIIMSDGTNILSYWDPATLKTVKTLQVSNAGYAEDYLNELEFIKGYIYANIWMKNYIVKIDPATGNVVATIDCASLMEEARQKNPNADVLNGIAYDPASDKIYLTGKLWKNIYQVDFPH
jgi:glutamine cyclotransferase